MNPYGRIVAGMLFIGSAFADNPLNKIYVMLMAIFVLLTVILQEKRVH